MIAHKNNKAFEEIYQRYSGKLYYYFSRMCSDKIVAQDLLQELFMKLISKAHLFDKNYSFSTWLYTIAYHQFINQKRRKSLIAPVTENAALNEPLDSFTENIDMDVELDHKLFREQVNMFLDNIDQEKRHTFILRYQQDLSISEIAEIMNCPAGTVKSRLHYLIKEIANRLAAFQDI